MNKPLVIATAAIATSATAPTMTRSLATRLRPGGDLVHLLAYDLDRTQPDEEPESGNHHRNVIHLADHGDEVGNEVEGRDQVDERQHQQGLGENRHPPIAEEPPVQPREVR